MQGGDIFLLILMILCIALSAFFSSIETAFSTVNLFRLRNYAEKGSKKAKRALYVTDNYDKALTTILIGNNIVNIGCSSIATVLCINLFGDIGAAVSTGAVTLLVLTFGEIIPKCVAKEKAEGFCLATAGVLRGLMVIFSPFVFLFIKLKTLVLRLFTKEEESPSVTEDELKVIIGTSEEEGVLEEQERELVQSALEFDEKTVQEILTPRVDVTAIDISDNALKNKEIILRERYSRIPVYTDNLDNIIGVLHTRDYLEAIIYGETPNIEELIQPAYFVYKTKKLSSVLSEFKRQKLHIAIVADEYGGTLGIVTMEDLLEEIVGDIWDEDEVEKPEFRKINDKKFIINGDMSIDDMLELLGLKEDFIESENISVGGWVMENLGDIPEKGDRFIYEDALEITVSEINEQRVSKVTVVILPEKEEN